MNRNDFEEALKKMGLKKGDIVLLHSSLLSLGDFDGGPEDVVEAFLSVLGPQGTLAVPVFGALGILTDIVKKRKDAVISEAPVGTLAAIGAKAKEICKDHAECETAHGEGTPYLKIADLDGYICLLGVDQDRNTSLHSVEALLQLPYLGEAKVSIPGPDGKPVQKIYKYYPGPHRDFIGLDHYLRESQVMQVATIGNAVVRLMKSSEMMSLLMDLGEMDPAFALCDNPSCADCVRQRAAIFADRIKNQETFKLSASSKLAGYYVPEMIENLLKSGLTNIELDYVQGVSAVSLPAPRLAAVCKELKAGGITVSGLRVPVIPSDIDLMIAKLIASGIHRLILPIRTDLKVLTALKDSGIEFALANTQETSMDFNRMLLPIRNKFACSATFNPVNFVRANEHPFLYSWRVGRFIKYIEQLDMVDAKWDMTATRLAEGNSEVKELLSIIRCHSFSGWLTLGGGAQFPGTLKDAVDNFTDLLNHI